MCGEHKATLDDLISIVGFVHDQTDGLAVPTGRRENLVLGCMDIAAEHAEGIAILADHERWAPAFALVRPMVDSYVRGVWLSACATDDQLGLFETDKLRKTVQFADMVKAIETHFVKSTLLTTLRETGWSFMSDLTHTGPAHASRRISSQHLGANYPPEEVEQALRLAGAFALLAATFTVSMTSRSDVLEAIQVRTKSYAATRLRLPLSASSSGASVDPPHN